MVNESQKSMFPPSILQPLYGGSKIENLLEYVKVWDKIEDFRSLFTGLELEKGKELFKDTITSLS